MFRLSLAYFFDIGQTLQRLRLINGETEPLDAWQITHAAYESLVALYRIPILMSLLKTSYAHGQSLILSLSAVNGRDWNEKVMDSEIFPIIRDLNQFEIVFRSELSVANAYYVTDKKGYDISRLITNGEILFPAATLSKAPEAINDLQEAGRCIAFELSTAAGFHMLRALEAVLRRYWDAVSGGKEHPDQRNMGVYLSLMEKAGYGSPKTRAVLNQIKNLHRNSLMHPEDTLDLEEAISLLGIAQSVMTEMLKEMPEVVPEQEDLPFKDTTDAWAA